jgi:hypothetical protein
MGLESIPVFNEGQQVNCPTCGYPVRLVYRINNELDHYEPMDRETMAAEVNQLDAPRIRRLRQDRNGKRTVALVGMAPGTCGFAPADENTKVGGGLEVWGLNESHLTKWMKPNWTRWFQLHPKASFTREVEKRGGIGHYDWLKQNHGDKIIYMQYVYPEIPNSVEYPIHDMTQRFFGKLLGDERKRKYFTSTMAYMMPIAIAEGFQRIELYGFEMAADDEFVSQRPSAEFWIGQALGAGIEVYEPKECNLTDGPLYGYAGRGPRNEA